MGSPEHELRQLRQENEALRQRLQEGEQTLLAIRSGEVDALVVSGPQGEQLFSLKSADRTYRMLVEEMNAGALTLTEDGIILYANKLMERLLRTPLEKIVGAPAEQFIDPSDLASFQGLLGQARKAKIAQELRLTTGDGVPVPAYLSINFVALESEPVFCLAVTDLTQQKRDQRMLAEERLSRSIIEQTADILVVCDDRGRVTRASRSALDLIGRNCLHEPFDEAFHLRVNRGSPMPAEGVPDYEAFHIHQVISGGRFRSREAFIEKDGGPSNHLLLSAAPLLDADDQVAGAIVNLADISEKKDYERRLQASEAWLRTTLRSIGDAVIATDETGKVTFLNPVAQTLTGWGSEEAMGEPLTKVFSIVNEHTRQACESPVDLVLRRGVVVGLANHTVLITRDGKERIIADSGAPIRDAKGVIIGVVLVFRDVTEQVRMEEELVRNRQLESLGVLAGGLAHDFNNILFTIMGNISLARETASTGEDASDLLEEAQKASMRAQTLTRQLLTFAKGGAPVKETASIKEILKETAAFVLRGSKSNYELAIAEDIPSAELDPGQISQVIHNIVLNADQAMPAGGVIRIAAENCFIHEGQGVPLRPGRYIHIRIRDQGMGISEQHLARIFDPYFTTKQKGSGLGLTTCYSIIKKHDGHIAVESRLGGGTTFHIYLPASDKAVQERKHAPRLTGQGRILVMDDEAPLRTIVGRMLNKLGYEAECAADGAAAIEMYKKAKEAEKPYDAVILDLTVPGGMGGKETVRRLREIDPAVRAVVSSGYSDSPVLANFQEYGFRGILPKPYEPSSLSQVLHEVVQVDK